LTAAAGGAAIASVMPASAAGGISVQAWAAPAGSDSVLPFVGSIVQGPNGQEWFITYNGSNYGIGEATTGGTVTELQPSLNGTNNAYSAMVDGPDGFVWLVNNVGPDFLSAISSDGTQTAVDTAGTKNGLDITVLDGKLWVSDNLGQINQYTVTSTPSASLHQYQAYTGNPVAPDAIASTTSSDWIWFSDDTGGLHYMTSTGTPTAVAGSSVSHATHTMVQGPDGNLWAISDAANGYGNAIEQIKASDGSLMHTYSVAIPSGAELTAITVGSDGNLYFPEANATASAQGIGQLNPSTGTITNIPLPSGFALPTSNVYDQGFDIAPGPNNTVWFNAQTSGGKAAVGEVSGLGTTTTGTTATTTTSPGPGTVVFGRQAGVVHGVALLSATCNGGHGAVCAGQISLTATAVTRAHKHERKHAVLIGSATYNTSDDAFVLRVKISNTGLKLLSASPSHKLRVAARVTQTGGSPESSTLTLVGPKPKKKR
jgi:streptogramin lyase